MTRDEWKRAIGEAAILLLFGLLFLSMFWVMYAMEMFEWANQ